MLVSPFMILTARKAGSSFTLKLKIAVTSLEDALYSIFDRRAVSIDGSLVWIFCTNASMASDVLELISDWGLVRSASDCLCSRMCAGSKRRVLIRYQAKVYKYKSTAEHIGDFGQCRE